jgi:hypothetical protein
MKAPVAIEHRLGAHGYAIAEMLNEFGGIPAAELKTMKATYKNVCAIYGIRTPGKLLSGQISKLNKNETVTLGLALMPAKHSGIANLCAFADSCAETCVAFSGNGSYSTVHASRMAKTHLLTMYPYAFLGLLVDELLKAASKYKHLAIRLNTYSDIRWERVAPWLFDHFANVQFYDYTKHPMRSRPVDAMPKNYHLTYSVSERTTAQELQKTLQARRNIAVVVAIRSGKQSDTGEMRPIRSTWANRPTVDGDATDSRWEDPTGSVVMLRRKHTLSPFAPMVTTAQALERRFSK